MERLLQSLKIGVNEKIYLKDPESSELGKKILQASVEMLSEMGFEKFTFKKLGERINSNESSIYRYFESKHKLLVYLTSWYWGWKEYQLVFATNSISDPVLKLRTAIAIVTKTNPSESTFSHINEALLTNIVIDENSKSYLTKEVDEENKQGYFHIYKRLVIRISEMIKEVDPDYLYPASLASTILEGSIHQQFLSDHFKSITDCRQPSDSTDFFIHLALRALNIDENG